MNPDAFIQKIEDRSAAVGVIGLGYVGLPLAMTFCRKGFRVIGFDIDTEKCDSLNSGTSYISYIHDDEIRALQDFTATDDFSRIPEPDAVLICVPTPLSPDKEPDMQYIVSTVDSIGPYIRQGQLISLESTTYPGTTEEIVVRKLEEMSGLKAGEDVFISYSPERQDPNNREFTTESIPKVVGGYTSQCLRAAAALYRAVIHKVHEVSGTAVAEAAKLMENIFRSVNIALVNELKVIFEKMDIDIWEVIEAAKTKPFGFMPFYPGPGWGGHCIPIDPFYLAWKAREHGTAAQFIELAGEINRAMPRYVADKVREALGTKGKEVKGSALLLIGMAYKPDVDDLRESSSLRLMEMFESCGAQVDFHDPYIPVIHETREYPRFAGRKSVHLEKAGQYDCVIIATNHSDIDYRKVTETADLVVDTRNVCPKADNVIKA